ncbi:MAG TPA: hypothetical protein VGK46_06185 [Saprospiraceae bacterium]
MKLKLSMYVAFAGGILTPFLETIRRWHQLSDARYFISWFDDYIIGAFLFFAAWKTYNSLSEGQKYLRPPGGFASGMAFYSFFSQLQSLDQPDPAPVSSVAVAVVKGIMLLTCVTSLLFSFETIKPGK